MEITKLDEKTKPREEVKKLGPKAWALADLITEYRVVQILMETDRDGGAPAIHIAKRLKLTRGRICQVLKKLEKEKYVVSDTQLMKCYICSGTGISTLYPDRSCLSCKGEGVKIKKGNPVFYSINPEIKNEIDNLIKVAENYKKLETRVFKR